MTLRDDLEEMVLAESKWKRREIGYPEHQAILGSLDEYPEAFVGRSHITIPQLKTRFILYTDFPVTVGECARRYLKWCYEEAGLGPGPTLRAKWNHPWFSKRAPVFVEPVRLRALSYVDIGSAYWQILRHYCADVVIRQNDHALYPGTVPFLRHEEIDTDRGLRHAVGGSLFASRITVYQYGRPTDRRVPSRFANPTLQMLAYDTLSAIAWDIKRNFELYAWLTDGGIVWDPDGTFGELVTAYLAERWRISARVTAWGAGEVNNAGNHRVGSKESRDFERLRNPIPFNGLPRVNVKRLRKWRLEACPKVPSGSANVTGRSHFPGIDLGSRTLVRA